MQIHVPDLVREQFMDYGGVFETTALAMGHLIPFQTFGWE